MNKQFLAAALAAGSAISAYLPARAQAQVPATPSTTAADGARQAKSGPANIDGVSWDEIIWTVTKSGTLYGHAQATYGGREMVLTAQGVADQGVAHIDSVKISGDPRRQLSFSRDDRNIPHVNRNGETTDPQFLPHTEAQRIETVRACHYIVGKLEHSAQQALPSLAPATPAQTTPPEINSTPPAPPPDETPRFSANSNNDGSSRPIPPSKEMAVGISLTGPGIPAKSWIAMVRPLDSLPAMAQAHFGDGTILTVDPNAPPVSPLQAAVDSFVKAHERDASPAPAVIHDYPNRRDPKKKPDKDYLRIQIGKSPVQVEINTSSGRSDPRYPERRDTSGIIVHGLAPEIVVVVKAGGSGKCSATLYAYDAEAKAWGKALTWDEKHQITWTADNSVVYQRSKLPADQTIRHAIRFAAFAVNMARAADKDFHIKGDDELIKLANKMAAENPTPPDAQKAPAFSLRGSQPQ